MVAGVVRQEETGGSRRRVGEEVVEMIFLVRKNMCMAKEGKQGRSGFLIFRYHFSGGSY